MKTRYLFPITLAVLVLYVLGAGCTQNFGAFATCTLGTKLCGNTCVAIDDPAFGCGVDACGACDVTNATAMCASTKCEIKECIGTFQNCDPAKPGCETDVANDPTQCGACGHLCMVANAMPACKAGQCTIGACDPTWDSCNGKDDDGCETNLQSDAKNCGKCGNACPNLQSCVAGKCALVCPDGKGDCNNNPDDGCETDITNPQNCGMCGVSCDGPNVQKSTCSSGKCIVTQCDKGFEDCDKLPGNGCEVDIDNDTMNCGSCLNKCPAGANGTSVCSNGKCDINCNGAFGNCDGDLQNGCETDTNTNDANCGACKKACSPQNGTGMCSAGNCTITGCNGAFADCDKNPNNGCEVNTSTSTGNCGMCGNGCSFANAGASCQNSMCVMGNCNAGFGNCNGNSGDGCETATSNNVNNCGMCGKQCGGGANGTAACMGGNCNLNCNAGFGNCNGMLGDGCESAIDTDVNNCGACGRACSNGPGTSVLTKSCTGGLCDSTCKLGSDNCSMPPAPMADNGCETVTASGGLGTSQHCGSCANNCELQGGANNKFECDGGGAAQKFCGCGGGGNPDDECRGPGVNGGSGVCAGGGLCKCSGITCNPSEWCILSGGNAVCSCNGGAACTAGQTCCQTPNGCKDLQTDEQNCGACGYQCAAGQTCNAGVCQ